MGLLWLLVFPGLAWGVPGWLASSWALPRATPLERVATSLLFGASLVVPIAFITPYVLRKPLGPIGVLLAAAGVSAVFGALLLRQHARGRVAPAEPPRTSPLEEGWAVVAAVVAMVVVNALTMIPRSFEGVEIFSPCPHQASMFLLEDGSGEGLRTYDPLWGREVEHVTEHPLEPGFGIAKILTIQRIGSAATLVQHFVFHGSGALVVATGTYMALIGLFSALFAARGLRALGVEGADERRLAVRRRLAVVVISAVTLMGYRLAGAYMVNENQLAAGLATGALWLLCHHRLAQAAPSTRLHGLAAVVFAHAVGTRPELALLLPAVLVLGRPWTVGRFALAGATLFAFVVPWLLTSYENFGRAFYHPSLVRGQIPLEVFGIEFHFHPLNWPFASELMRPADEPFPNLITRPLEDLWSFGVPMMALVVWGAWLGFRRGALRTAPLLLWVFPIYLVLLAIVNLDRDKLSYAVMCFGPLPYWAAVGLSALPGSLADWRRGLAPVTLALVLAAGPQALRSLQLPIDPRPQFNESREARDFDPVDVKLDRLLRPTLVGLPNADDAAQALEWTSTLLWHGRPVHRSAGVAQGVVHFWVEQRPFARQVAIEPMPAPAIPPYVADPRDLELTKNYVPVSLLVPGGAPCTVRFTRDTGLGVDVTCGDGAPSHYLTVGLLDDGDQSLEELEVTLNGRVQTLEVLVVERRGRPLRPLLVANHPWHYEVLTDDASAHGGTPGDRLVLVPGPWGSAGCPPMSDDALVLGDEGLLDRRDPERPVLLWRSADFPPREPPRCEALTLPSG